MGEGESAPYNGLRVKVGEGSLRPATLGQPRARARLITMRWISEVPSKIV